MPGMGDLQSMLSKMGMNAGKGSGKVNVSAMQSNLDKKLKEAKNRERMVNNMEKRKAAATQAATATLAPTPDINKLYDTSNPENLVFSTGETVERSTPSDKKPSEKKKKKNKK